VLSARAWGEVALSGDGRVVALTEDTDDGAASVVIDLDSGERVLELDPFTYEGQGNWVVQALNHDGSLLVAGNTDKGVWDVATGEHLTTFRGHGGDASAVFAPDGDIVFSGGVDGAVRQWDARTGVELDVYPAVGSGLRPSVSASGRALVADLATQSATLIDTRPRAELWAVDTCPGFVWAQTLSVTDRHGALSVECADGEHRTYVIDLAAEEVAYELPGHRAQDLAVSPDGTRFVRQESDATRPQRARRGPRRSARARTCDGRPGRRVRRRVRLGPVCRRVVDGAGVCRRPRHPLRALQLGTDLVAGRLDGDRRQRHGRQHRVGRRHGGDGGAPRRL
jgi:hypothetical protein